LLSPAQALLGSLLSLRWTRNKTKETTSTRKKMCALNTHRESLGLTLSADPAHLTLFFRHQERRRRSWKEKSNPSSSSILSVPRPPLFPSLLFSMYIWVEKCVCVGVVMVPT
jgi:hypothetical protein